MPEPAVRADSDARSASRPAIAFLVNGDAGSAMALRAAQIAARLASRFAITIAHREAGRGWSAVRFEAMLHRVRPVLCCVFDHGADGVMAAIAWKAMTNTPWILDTGDDIVALGQALGRGPLAMQATRWLDRLGYASASHVIVRGRGHLARVAERGHSATWIPDGVDLAQFSPSREDSCTSRAMGAPLVIGMLGSITWSPTRRTSYGQDLIDTLHTLRSDGSGVADVRGELIGDGDGLDALRTRANTLGVAHLVTFHGRQPLAALPAIMRRWNVCLSTQTNDAIGHVRTTGKLPLYLALGRFVLASDVGEAARVLPSRMLVPYDGEDDRSYPSKLAARILTLHAQGEPFGDQPECAVLAGRYFDYDHLAAEFGTVLAGLLPPLTSLRTAHAR
jgi:hypothetical protein